MITNNNIVVKCAVEMPSYMVYILHYLLTSNFVIISLFRFCYAINVCRVVDVRAVKRIQRPWGKEKGEVLCEQSKQKVLRL